MTAVKNKLPAIDESKVQVFEFPDEFVNSMKLEEQTLRRTKCPIACVFVMILIFVLIGIKLFML